MIQITVDEQFEHVAKVYCKKIYDSFSKIEKEKLNLWVKDYLLLFQKDYFEDGNNRNSYDYFFQIMIAPYEDLLAMKKYIDSRYVRIKYNKEKYKIPQRRCSGQQPKYIKIDDFLINKYKSIDKKEFVKLTGIVVCPYCNRNYVNVTEEKGEKGKRTYNSGTNNSQLDHFFSKSARAGGRKYPIFALSFFNLIPSCYGCNNKKGSEDFELSPYDKRFRSDDLIIFNWQPQPNQKSSIFSKDSITITCKVHEEFKKDFDYLNLEKNYQLHTDIVEELLWKKRIYTGTYKEKLVSNYKKIGLDMSEINRAIVGNFIEEDDYGKRPLSKMMADIGKNIRLIGDSK